VTEETDVLGENLPQRQLVDHKYQITLPGIEPVSKRWEIQIKYFMVEKLKHCPVPRDFGLHILLKKNIEVILQLRIFRRKLSSPIARKCLSLYEGFLPSLPLNHSVKSSIFWNITPSS
jgi:hypothetical protein